MLLKTGFHVLSGHLDVTVRRVVRRVARPSRGRRQCPWRAAAALGGDGALPSLSVVLCGSAVLVQLFLALIVPGHLPWAQTRVDLNRGHVGEFSLSE